MKKLIAVLTSLAMLLSMAAMLSACGGDDPTTAPTTTAPTAHTHSFGTEWKSNADNHWNECACGEKSNSAAHTDADVDGKCDICSANVPIPSHEHSFGTEWVSDETNHWNVCECGEKANEAAHADADVDGKCDVCSADVPLPPPTPHEHSFGTEWVSDENNHWNVCECGEKANEAAHADDDVDGKCDVCDADVPLPPHEHSFGAGWASDENTHWNVCDCGEKANQAAHVDANTDGKCDICQYVMENQQIVTPNALVMGENAIAGEDITFTYTAAEAGTLTLEIRGPKFMSVKDVLNVSYQIGNGEAVTLANGSTTPITLNAGDVITITVVANCQGMVVASWEATPAASGNALVMGENAIAGEDITFTYTAAEAGTLTLEIRGPKFMSVKDVLNVSYQIGNGEAVTLANGSTTPITLNAGDVITITVVANCQGMVVASWEATPIAPAGNPLEIGTNTINREDVTYTYTATENGTMTITVTGPMFSAVADVLSVTYTVNNGDPIEIPKKTPTDIALNAGDILTVIVVTNTTGSVKAEWAATASSTPLQIGTNSVAKEDATFVYTATEEGTLNLTLTGPMMSTPSSVVNVTYSINGGEVVTLVDRTPTDVALNANDVITIVVVTNENITIAAAWTAGPAAPSATPLEIGENLVKSEDITFEYTAKASGTLTITAVPPKATTPMTVFTVTVSLGDGESETLSYNTPFELFLKEGTTVTVTVTANCDAMIQAAWADDTGDDPKDPETTGATISFADATQRTEMTGEQQVWAADGLTVTNAKANSTNEVKDYVGPVRFYAHTSLTVSYTGMTSIKFVCNSETYANNLKDTIAAADGVTVTVEGNVVTVTFDKPVDTFVIADFAKQVRVDSIEVTA